MSEDEFIHSKAGQAVITEKGRGKITGHLVKTGGELRLIVDHGARHLIGLDLVPVVWSYSLSEVALAVRSKGQA